MMLISFFFVWLPTAAIRIRYCLCCVIEQFYLLCFSCGILLTSRVVIDFKIAEVNFLREKIQCCFGNISYRLSSMLYKYLHSFVYPLDDTNNKPTLLITELNAQSVRHVLFPTLCKFCYFIRFRKDWWSPGGGGTWPMFGYRGAAEGLKSWPCLGQEYAKHPTLCRTTASISRPCLGQVTKCTLSGFTWI